MGLWSLVIACSVLHPHQVVFFLRAVELADGRWLTKRGRSELGVHATLDDALVSLEQLRDELESDVEVRVHRTRVLHP